MISMTAKSSQINLSIAVPSIAVTMPLGVIGIKLTGPRQPEQETGEKANIP